MPPRKQVNGNTNSTSEQTACSYLRDFCDQYRKYRSNPNEENLALIHRSVSLLLTISSHQFNKLQTETTQFFVNLHALIGILDDTDVLWPCINLLENCSKNEEVRQALVQNYCFLPVLTSVLTRIQMLAEKATRLLALLQDLTFGIVIKWEEPYLGKLLDYLQQTVVVATEEGEEKQAMLALSIMINLCYKNFPVLLLFMRTVNISEFSRKIQRYGALANKMMIVLAEDVYKPELKEFHLLLRTTFVSVLECLREWNVAHLRHIVDFLTDSKSHTGLHNAMLQYPAYCEDIERLLGILENNDEMNESKEETRKQHQQSLSMVFKFILYILKLSSIRDKDGNENIISLDSIVPRIFDLICHWIESDICGTDAVRLLDGLINLAKGESLTPRIARDPSVVTQLIAISESTETSPEHTIAILQLLLSLLKQTKTEKLILSKISESFFDKIFSPLLTNTAHRVTAQEAEKTVFCLLLLINFAGIAKKAYFEKCCTTLQMSQIQSSLALATLSDNECVCNAVFKISQFEHFPCEAIAKNIAFFNSSRAKAHHGLGTPCDVSEEIQELLKRSRQFASTKTEERLLALMESITLAQRNNQLNNVSTTKIMELYNYSIEKYKFMEEDMQRRLEEASSAITRLSQRISVQNAEFEKYHNMNFELQINIQSMEDQNQDLKQQREDLKRNLTELLKKSSQQSESLQICQKRLTVKASELIALNKEYSDLKDEMRGKTAQLEKLECQFKENVGKIEKFKKTIAAFEGEIEDKIRRLDEKEHELVKVNKALEAEREAKKKADGFITVLEGQIQEKNEELRNYERELSETEELRKTIMSLMESKKPKRK